MQKLLFLIKNNIENINNNFEYIILTTTGNPKEKQK